MMCRRDYNDDLKKLMEEHGVTEDQLRQIFANEEGEPVSKETTRAWLRRSKNSSGYRGFSFHQLKFVKMHLRLNTGSNKRSTAPV